MAHAAAETHAPTQHHYTTTGLDNRKVAIWMFIGSECMLFASLISTYLIYKGKSLVGPYPHEAWTNPQTGQSFKAILDIPTTSISTFVLLMSSFAMVMALAAVENRKNPEDTVFHSKAVGEPPFMLGIAAWCAIKDAVASLSDYRIHPDIDAPAPPERVLWGVQQMKQTR